MPSRPNVSSRKRHLTGAARLVLGLFALVLLGTILLMLPLSSTKEPLSLGSAGFTAVSALATTGLSVITPGADLSTFGQIVLLMLMQIGGIGFIIGSVIVFLLLGRRVSLTERLALRDALGTVSAGSAIAVAKHVCVGVLVIELVGAFLLWLRWAPLFGVGRGGYLALWHSVSAFTNSSFDLFSGSPEAPAGFPLDAFTLLVVASLVISGSIGIPVLSDLLGKFKAGRRPYKLSLYTRLTLWAAGSLLVIGTLALFVGFSKPGTLFANEDWGRRLLMSFFHSATSRTSGFVLVPLSETSDANILVLTVLMFIGGSPASMGGGVTTSTLIIILATLTAAAKGNQQVLLGHRALPREVITKAFAVLTASLTFVVVVAWLLVVTQDASLEHALFEATSAFATCGFSLGLTAKLNGFGMALVAFTMFVGRLGVLTLLVALQQETNSSLLHYPEEKILLG